MSAYPESPANQAGSSPSPAPEPEVRTFRSHIRVLERIFSRMLAQQTGCCEVSLPQCHALLELEGAGCVNLNGLARNLDLDKSTLSRTVDSLVNMGLVNRSPDPANRRQQVICLSPSGLEKVKLIHQTCDTGYLAIMDRIPPRKLGQVLESFALVRAAFEQEPSLSRGAAGSVTCCGTDHNMDDHTNQGEA